MNHPVEAYGFRVEADGVVVAYTGDTGVCAGLVHLARDVDLLLAEAGISIDAVLQREADEIGGEGSTQTDVIILTHDTREGTLDDAIAQLQALPTVLAPIVRLRKEELS